MKVVRWEQWWQMAWWDHVIMKNKTNEMSGRRTADRKLTEALPQWVQLRIPRKSWRSWVVAEVERERRCWRKLAEGKWKRTGVSPYNWGAAYAGTGRFQSVSGCDVFGTIEVPPTPPDVSGTTISCCVPGCVVATIEVLPAPALATYCAGCREPFFLPDKPHLNRKALWIPWVCSRAETCLKKVNSWCCFIDHGDLIIKSLGI